MAIEYVRANQISNTPSGNISSTDLQSVVNELDTEKIGAGSAAGGDLGGTYLNPSVVKASGIFSFTGSISPATINTDQNNYSPTGLATATVIKAVAGSGGHITGLDATGSVDGTVKIIEVSGSAALVFDNESSSSLAANRFSLNGTVSVNPGDSIAFMYNGSRWICIGLGRTSLIGHNSTYMTGIGTNSHSSIDTFISNAPTTYAPIAKGVTNGDSHDHTGGDGGAIPASSIANTPAGSIAATNVQSALNELDTEKSGTGHDHSSIGGTAALATQLSGDQTNWASLRASSVANMLSWKNYGNGHVLFDASNSTSPTGASVNNTYPDNPWVATYPTLMGWNGSGTFGIRVDVAGRVDALSSPGWIAPTFQNSWSNLGSGYANAGYWKDQMGAVHITGLIHSGTIGQPCFTLPAGYRPASNQIITVLSNDAAAEVGIYTDGRVVPLTGSNAWVSLCNIHIFTT